MRNSPFSKVERSPGQARCWRGERDTDADGRRARTAEGATGGSEGHTRQREAAAELGVSVRWVKELVRRLREVGDRAVVHGLKGRDSNCKMGEEVKQKAVGLWKEHYRGLLEEEVGVQVSRETVRKWLVEAGL